MRVFFDFDFSESAGLFEQFFNSTSLSITYFQHQCGIGLEEPPAVQGANKKENPVCARVCFLIDPKINPSTLLRTGLGAKQY